MQLPNCSQAYIQPRKLTGYLLSKTHDVGKAKAKFFFSVGFSDTNPALLERELLDLAKTEEVCEVIETANGTKYVIVGSIKTPSNKTVTILTVWIVDNGEDFPRFVTARPYKCN